MVLFKNQSLVSLSVQQVLDCKELGTQIDSTMFGLIDQSMPDPNEVCSLGGSASSLYQNLFASDLTLVSEQVLPYAGET